MRELIIDLFAGGGGASKGIELALGISPDIAINHDRLAVQMHAKNHPKTRHFCQDVWSVQPNHVTGGRPVGLLHASPDCTHFSRAKGAKPKDGKIRDLAWVIVRWAEEVRPRVITMENVEEFKTWGPLDREGQPVKSQAGATFRAFVNRLKRLGYRVQWRELTAYEYGAPTIRKRFFLVARCDGAPIVWPTPTHGRPDDARVVAGELAPWRTAAEIIDWSIPCPSIFLTPKEAGALGVKRPLADNTLRRVAKGIQRYVLDAAEPFIVACNHGGNPNFQGQDINSPLWTVTGKPSSALVSPTLVQVGYGEREGQSPRVPGLEKPLGTVVAGGCKHALVANMLRQFGGSVGADMDSPVPTVMPGGGGKTQLLTASCCKLRGTNTGHGAREPLHTVSAGGTHHALQVAHLMSYYGNERDGRDVAAPLGTVTARDRHGLVTVDICGATYVLCDIGLRMLTPRELYRAQGFPDTYIIDFITDNGKPLPKAAQVRMCGNSVPPPVYAALVAANFAPQMAQAQPALWTLPLFAEVV